MGNPGYSLAASSPVEIVEFPKSVRSDSSLLGKNGGPIERERTDNVFETEEGVKWIRAKIRRRKWTLHFRVTISELEIFEALDLSVDGQRVAFYFYPDVDNSAEAYLVRKDKDFKVPAHDQLAKGMVRIFDYVLELIEESEAAQILA